MKNPFKTVVVFILFLIQVVWAVPGLLIGTLTSTPRLAWQAFNGDVKEDSEDYILGVALWPQILARRINRGY